MNPRFRLYLLLILLSVLLICQASAYELPRWFPFDQSRALDVWQEKIFKGRVLYQVKANPGAGYLSAKSNSTSSGLVYRIKYDVMKSPLISWEWMVKTFPAKKTGKNASGGWIERDDYAVRVYVIFPSWNYLNTRTLEYVWDADYPDGTILTSPYFKNIKLFVIESGRKNLNRWVFEERNIPADYKKAFGGKPPRYVGAVAIMTDADNSSSIAEASYKNLRIGYEYGRSRK